MAATGEQRERRGAFFGRCKGKKLRPHQALLLDTLLPKLAIDLSAPAPIDLSSLFPAAADDVRLEIGFGGGEHLILEAERHPGTGFIGVEPFTNGMAKALAAIAARNLGNIRLHHGDATDVLSWLPRAGLACVDLIYPDPWPKRRHWKRRFIQPASIAELVRVLKPGGEFRFVTDIADYAAWTLARVDLIYPDPWPKRRHWKRRFIQAASITELARVLKPGGEFRFVTDIADYAAWTLARVLRSPGFIWRAERAADWKLPWPGFSETRYEAKAKRVGRLPCYLVFKRK